VGGLNAAHIAYVGGNAVLLHFVCKRVRADAYASTQVLGTRSRATRD